MEQNKIPVVTIDDNIAWLTAEEADEYRKSLLNIYEACKPKTGNYVGKVVLLGSAGEHDKVMSSIIKDYIDGTE